MLVEEVGINEFIWVINVIKVICFIYVDLFVILGFVISNNFLLVWFNVVLFDINLFLFIIFLIIGCFFLLIFIILFLFICGFI